MEAFHLIYFHVGVILFFFCSDSNLWRDIRCQDDFDDAICHSEEDRVIFLLLEKGMEILQLLDEDKMILLHPGGMVILLHLGGRVFLQLLDEDKVILLHIGGMVILLRLGGRGFLLHLEEDKVILLHLEGKVILLHFEG